MRAFLLVTTLALMIPLAAACAEDDAAPGAGSGGAPSQGGAGGQGLTPQITPTSDAACPKAPPGSGERCERADDATTCVYDGTDCQRFDARCHTSVWTVLVVRETTCIERFCPVETPHDGDACEESATPGTNDCLYGTQKCGESRHAVCDGTKWTVAPAPDSAGCQLTCPDAQPKLGSACTGYAINGCGYDNDCGQTYSLQCSNGVWTAWQGRATCTEHACPETSPAPAESCLAYDPNLYCSYPSSCASGRVARCNEETWVVTDYCNQ